eukprot:862817-Pyramimonas_sp.AAC.1
MSGYRVDRDRRDGRALQVQRRNAPAKTNAGISSGTVRIQRPGRRPPASPGQHDAPALESPTSAAPAQRRTKPFRGSPLP